MLHRRGRRDRRSAGQAPDRDGVPVLRALSSYDRPPEHRLFSLYRWRVAKGAERKDGGGRAHAAAGAAARSAAGAALWRSATARCDRPRAGAGAAGLSVRRAALQSRRHAAGADAARTGQAAPGSRHDDDLCHPRPDRGDDSRGQDRRARQGAHIAGRHAARALQFAGQQVRRFVHRLARHELLRSYG